MPFFSSHDGTWLWYEIAGDGPPLICLAGGPGGDGRDLEDLGELTQDRSLVLLDGRAIGRSAALVDQDSCAFTERARDVEELRRHLGLASMDLLAHSSGTLTAQEYAARCPGRLGRLVLVAPVGRVSVDVDEDELAAIRLRHANQPWYSEAMAAFERRASGTEQTAEHDEADRQIAPLLYGEWSERIKQRRDRVAAIPDPPLWARAAYLQASATADTMSDRLARLRAVPNPVLALAGELDAIAGSTPARLVESCYPAGQMKTITGAGHWAWVNRPDEFRTLVNDFLEGRQ